MTGSLYLLTSLSSKPDQDEKTEEYDANCLRPDLQLVGCFEHNGLCGEHLLQGDHF